jgi:hypothetical protein
MMPEETPDFESFVNEDAYKDRMVRALIYPDTCIRMIFHGDISRIESFLVPWVHKISPFVLNQ